MEKLIKQIQDELDKKSPNLTKVGDLTEKLLGSDDKAMRFSVDAQHIHRLGFELVGKQETAIGELVKNSYDADATTVNLLVEDYLEPGGRLTISDDGLGMTEADIRNKWMKLSTPDKVNNPTSKLYGRSRAGRKGIGRFAAERLGKKLILESYPANNKLGIRVTFEWENYLKNGKSLYAIENKIEHFSKPKDRQGTTLIIEDLRDRWKDTDFDKLWKSLLLLQSPFLSKRQYRRAENQESDKDDPGFQIVINGKDNSEVAIDLSMKKSLLAHQTALIKGRIDKKGKAFYSVQSKVLDFSEKHSSENSYFLTGKLDFEAHYFIYTSDLVSGISVRQASKLGQKYGGVRVYRDGFRVMPYAEEHDDWLRLGADSARRSILVPLSNYNLFAHIELTSADNVLFEETASREGFIENEAYEELRDFIREALEWAATRIASRRGRKQTASEKGFISTVIKKPTEILGTAIEEVKQSSSDSVSRGSNEGTLEILAEAMKEVESFEKSVDKRDKEHIEYEALLRILASLGITIAVFSHETQGALTQVLASLEELKKAMPQKINAPLFDEMNSSMDRLESLSSYIIDQLSHTRSREKQPVPISGALTSFIKQFKTYLNARGIEFEVDVTPKWLRTELMHPSEIDSVLFNFLTNSIKAMDRGSIKDQSIKITAFVEGKFAVIRFQDTGKGVSPNIEDSIFDAFFTTSDQSRDSLSGPGTGLGLKIVSDIATSNNGFVRVGKPDPGFGGCFEFGVPMSEKQKKGS